jgi:2-isopropylmalate synthase
VTQQRQHLSRSHPRKYVPYEALGLTDRTWPDKRITTAPRWCSVDLRDGNQALLHPMGLARKREMFELLVRLGFKEIEVGLPASGAADRQFIRDLARRDAVPDDVTIQVMCPIRPELLDQTVDCLRGFRRAILQVYNPTSAVQRRVVFRAGRAEIKALALAGAEHALRLRDKMTGTFLALQYAPESFTQTEPDFALEVCNDVVALWQPAPSDDVRLNLPATVEAFPPQEFADRIEWMHRNLAYRDAITLSVHPHNDRGTAVAAAEAAVLAGADRIEGCLFGNGERTGNVCLVTLAVNLLSQGVDPMLSLSDIDDVRRTVERCTEIPVDIRHPWAGDLVYTSLAGTHQDAISKGLQDRAEHPDQPWDVPYLPIDPADLGRDYKALIRISNQSGKGGVAHVLREFHGLSLPRRFQIEFSAIVQEYVDEHGGEVAPDLLWSLFQRHYLPPDTVPGPWLAGGDHDAAAVLAGFAGRFGVTARVLEVSQQVVAGSGDQGVQHACYAEIEVGSVMAGRQVRWGAGLAPNPATARRSAVAVAFTHALAASGVSGIGMPGDIGLPQAAGATP